jgi:hypothetical protein
MKKNIINFAGAAREEYIRLSEINEIFLGFTEAKILLQPHLIKLIQSASLRDTPKPGDD